MPAVTTITRAAPQFLVRDLEASLAFYGDRLGFTTDFVYEGFYASVSRDGATIHLKHGQRPAGEAESRRAEEHLDAYLDVTGVRQLHAEFVERDAPIDKPLDTRPWGAIDFYVVDPDGYILCFSETP